MGFSSQLAGHPVLAHTGLILTLAIERANIGQGVVLLTSYSLGMAIPFLAAALAWAG